MIRERAHEVLAFLELTELKDEYAGKVDIYKIDTEDQRTLAGMFGIQSIPSILFVPAEGQPQMANGALPKDSFKKAISDIFKIELAETV